MRERAERLDDIVAMPKVAVISNPKSETFLSTHPTTPSTHGQLQIDPGPLTPEQMSGASAMRSRPVSSRKVPLSKTQRG